MRVTVRRPVAHRCPYRDELDLGTLEASWTGAEVELHDLASWLDQFVDAEVTHETLTDRVAARIAHLGGVDPEVITRWNTAGMSVEARA